MKPLGKLDTINLSLLSNALGCYNSSARLSCPILIQMGGSFLFKNPSLSSNSLCLGSSLTIVNDNCPTLNNVSRSSTLLAHLINSANSLSNSSTFPSAATTLANKAPATSSLVKDLAAAALRLCSRRCSPHVQPPLLLSACAAATALRVRCRHCSASPAAATDLPVVAAGPAGHRGRCLLG
ncbi:hypothetical protein Nepgr_017287 [Nepenthes gracilis]|uniref:Uncharacterized protein n=1 Tax=Nepenthes gracilis TaxID=150966 RepID=A0AAD3SRR8_NEPGR|nr:hypothetical protein Nepgr_017287 [Nepenthes gracilis]